MELKPQQGLVGFFDILGYQQIIDNNDIAIAARLISTAIISLPGKVKSVLTGRFSAGNRSAIESDLSAIECRVISDSIVATCPQTGKTPAEIHWNNILFVTYCAQLLRSSFDAGLPLRGAIDYGEYYLDKDCFAGQPIIDAYRLSCRLPFSGAVATPKCAKLIDESTESGKPILDRFVSALLFPMTVELKNMGSQKLYLLNWISPFSDWGTPPNDIRTFVYTSFHAHNKDIGDSARYKAELTELTIRKSLSQTRAPEPKNEIQNIH